LDTIIVEKRRDLKEFVTLPWKIYAESPQWVPPLKRDVIELLDPSRHPFWNFSERILFLVKRNSVTLGRIAGIIDRNFNEYHREKSAVWGFFECIDEVDVAQALFSSVETWARQKGMTHLRGPLNPSTNYEAGMLIDGFLHRPCLMMTYNPPYYPRLVESCAFQKEMDLFSFLAERGYQAPEWMQRGVERVKKDKNIWIRPVRPREFESEASLIRKIYHDAWSDNWGFVPTTEDEFRWIAKSVARVLEKDNAFFLYYRQEPVGVGFMLPDINPLIKRLNGRFGPLGLLKILLYRREVDGVRGFMLGIKKDYQRIGLPLAAFDHLMNLARKNQKYRYLEFGWNLESNEQMNQALLEGGLSIHNRYRIFRKAL
jgi:hypothetical protein